MQPISIAAEKITSIAGLPVTNSLLATWFVMAILILLSLVISRNIAMVPSRLQVAAEMLIGGFYDFFKTITGRLAPKAFPLIMSIFLFIVVANWSGLLPGFGTVGIRKTEHEKVAEENPAEESREFHPSGEETNPIATETETEFLPILRGPTADINMTLAIAIIAVTAIQYFGFKTLGFHYSKRFIDVSNPINFFIGILEIISESSKIISFAFRLFGNIFAGEVLLTVMAFLVPYIAPLPFISLELFVGFIQALVFSMLTAVFLNVAVSHGGEAHAEGRG